MLLREMAKSGAPQATWRGSLVAVIFSKKIRYLLLSNFFIIEASVVEGKIRVEVFASFNKAVACSVIIGNLIAATLIFSLRKKSRYHFLLCVSIAYQGIVLMKERTIFLIP